MLGIVILTCTMPASASVWGRLVSVLGAGFPLNRTTDQTPVGLLARDLTGKKAGERHNGQAGKGQFSDPLLVVLSLSSAGRCLLVVPMLSIN